MELYGNYMYGLTDTRSLRAELGASPTGQGAKAQPQQGHAHAEFWCGDAALAARVAKLATAAFPLALLLLARRRLLPVRR